MSPLGQPVRSKVHTVVDIETASTQSDAAILSIAAVSFTYYYDLPHKSLSEEETFCFYMNRITLESNELAGLDIDRNTIKWWKEQPAEAQREVFSHIDADSDTSELKYTLDCFNQYLRDAFTESLWGYGSDFDNVIIKNAMDAVGIKPEFKYKDNRCLRTLLKLHPTHKPRIEPYVPHHAAYDAMAEAANLYETLKHLESMGVNIYDL